MPYYDFRAPNLPIAKDQYDRVSYEAFLNAIRLYFNRIDITVANTAFRPTALYYSTQIQTASIINTAYPVTFNNVYFEHGMEIDAPNTKSAITVAKEGIYNFQFSGQLFSGSSSAKTAQIWLRRSGVDIGYSAHAYTDDMNNGYLEVNWNFNIDLRKNEYIQIMWATESTGLYFNSVAPSAPYPGISSVVMAVNFISTIDGFTIAATP
jgi:hypothetical protein